MKQINEKINECLNCKTKPCKSGCPLGNEIPEVINLMKNDLYEQAYKILTQTTVLPAVCGRVCPHMRQCMGKCIRGIKGVPVSIGEIEAFLADMSIKKGWKIDCLNNGKLNKKVAVIGSGPAGLTCAAFLARAGFKVTIYEKNEKLGGLLRYGIPDFRLDREVLDNTVNKILGLGINVEYGKKLGENLSIEQLKSEYDAIFLGIGANIPWKMGVNGENLKGVYGGNFLLENINKINNENKVPSFENKKVAIIGGGNVAIDCARTAKKFGAKEVKIIYRRSIEEMPADKKEIEEAINEGVEILFKNNVIKIIGDEKVEKIECVKTELIQKEGDIRLSPIDINGSNYKLDVDYVIMAIGSQPEQGVLERLNLELDSKGYIKINDKYRTSDEKIWAGGDISGSKATVAWAARSGRNAAESIMNLL